MRAATPGLTTGWLVALRLFLSGGISAQQPVEIGGPAQRARPRAVDRSAPYPLTPDWTNDPTIKIQVGGLAAADVDGNPDLAEVHFSIGPSEPAKTRD